MKRLLCTLALVASSATGAFAVDEAVKTACRDDYHKFCDKMEVGSPELRSCMKTNATQLSKDCLKALVEHKEVTQADIDEYLKEMEAKAQAEQK